jgi:hypothetical protein
MTIPKPEYPRLKPLVMVCYPEGAELYAADAPPESPVFSDMEIAVSDSGCRRGLLRRFAGRFPTHSPAESEALLARLNLFDLVLFAPLSLNSLAKCALGIADSLPSRLFAAAQILGKPILLDGSVVPATDSAMNPHLMKVYRRHWENIRGGTVREFSPENLPAVLAGILRGLRAPESLPVPGGRSVITRDDVLAARDCLGPLKIPRGAIVTELARETARELGIHFDVE